ncbi:MULTISPECIES: class I SAM-dependent methyltransferase [Thermomonospora]|uniref:Methyltransferase type 11 n=1 Tax=Thermomonospora curvata (strain ATCC 19995 / DSM 43183 / JCM 3096 / KCTC 9072 / NBRC 15933 / NCIMB 10081 / Henssen B9) TaxID=471852 RepID=D1A2B2_THECD|nr:MULTISPECIES: class I SAM-dependent methyltransferase [Thermomonospora]ACY99765.1 Methyltransferase type 11 [Thermomonospora curvata DSM 43183]PKK12770.1 MAG: class I SAM-dependent methyltransferase [Thermomonospora sp. CIF 1]
MDTVEIQRVVAIEDDNWWYRERRAIIARELRRLGGPPGRAADIGAAGGGNTRVLVEHGWEAIAIDASPEAVELAKRRGIDAYHGDACYLPLSTGDFDFVMALDVLQHIPDDQTAAGELARVLRPGGVALISVPCDLSLWSAHDVALGHVRRYSRESLAALIEGAGLQLDRMWSWNVLLRPVVKWRRHRSAPQGAGRLNPVVNAGLRAVVMLERYLPVRSLPGVTLFARAHRPELTSS